MVCDVMLLLKKKKCCCEIIFLTKQKDVEDIIEKN